MSVRVGEGGGGVNQLSSLGSGIADRNVVLTKNQILALQPAVIALQDLATYSVITQCH
jgi:hypothetical protein